MPDSDTIPQEHDWLKFEHEKCWRASEFWSQELNKLTYWLLVLVGLVSSTFVEQSPVMVAVCCLGPTGWILMYCRAVWYYRQNISRIREIEERVVEITKFQFLFRPVSRCPIGVFQSGQISIWVVIVCQAICVYCYCRAVKGNFSGKNLVPSLIVVSSLALLAYAVFRTKSIIPDFFESKGD